MCRSLDTGYSTDALSTAISGIIISAMSCGCVIYYLFSKPNNHSISVCRERIGLFIGGVLTDYLDFQTSAVVSKSYLHKNLCTCISYTLNTYSYTHVYYIIILCIDMHTCWQEYKFLHYLCQHAACLMHENYKCIEWILFYVTTALYSNTELFCICFCYNHAVM